MAYDFNGAKSITIGNRDVSKITNKATGEVIWEKLYYWEKYELIEVVTNRTLNTATSVSTISAPTSGHMYKTASIDDSGNIILSDVAVWDYWDKSDPPTTGWWKSMGHTSYEGYYFKSGSNYYQYKYGGVVTGGENVQGYKLSVRISYNRSRGDYIEIVSSNKSSYYPTNSYQGGYWYVKIS